MAAKQCMGGQARCQSPALPLGNSSCQNNQAEAHMVPASAVLLTVMLQRRSQSCICCTLPVNQVRCTMMPGCAGRMEQCALGLLLTVCSSLQSEAAKRLASAKRNVPTQPRQPASKRARAMASSDEELSDQDMVRLW